MPTAIVSAPVTFWYVAWMVTDPLPTPATTPVDDTVALAEFDDDQVARLVTSCVVPFASVAVAVNCDDAPIGGGVPLTVTVEIDVGDVDEPHAAVNAISSAASALELARRTRVYCV